MNSIDNNNILSKKLSDSIDDLKNLLRELKKLGRDTITKQELDILSGVYDMREKVDIMQNLSTELNNHLEEIQNEDASIRYTINLLDEEIKMLQDKLKELSDRKLSYPWYTKDLKEAIEKEFSRRDINSRIYIAAELLEVTDAKWQNAVEGYFNTQKFNLIVEPEYYDTALEVYNKNKNKIHTAGIINTKKLIITDNINSQSLAYVVHSENRYAKAYADYILGRVTRCDDIKDLENHKIAITAECMLYQGYVTRNLDKETYRNPFIGQNAYQVQIVNTREELTKKSAERNQMRESKKRYIEVLSAKRRVNLELLSTYLEAPLLKKKYEEQLNSVKIELHEAKKDPTLIEIIVKIEGITKIKKEQNINRARLEKENGTLTGTIKQLMQRLDELQYELIDKEKSFEIKADADVACLSEAEGKYQINRKTKTPKAIVENFSRQKSQFANERDELLNGDKGLKTLQDRFNLRFDQDYMRGIDGISDYIDTRQQLQAVELIRFEERLRKTKEDCEEIFKSDFLAKMRENIENARSEFKSLNKALDNIYYGEDSYRFVITYDKKKESLYRMITSENNHEGYNLWTKAFEAEYKEEMAELFDKLITKDDSGQKVIEEYTDYRSYLDYDIEIHKKNGSIQKFSSIYGEKSGSETQVPYYVAIAASFYQLYRLGNTVRIMLLDEAFDKMDDERIDSMMDFLKSLDLQVILATPPAKLEVIGEKVDTILTAIRAGSRSIVEEYDL